MASPGVSQTQRPLRQTRSLKLNPPQPYWSTHSGGSTHSPPEQVWLPVHASSQPPQWRRSVWVLTHWLPQRVPEAQAQSPEMQVKSPPQARSH